MGKKKVQRKTCFMLGVLGAVATLAAGVLIAAAIGQATLPRAIGFAFNGAMLLFMATTEGGAGGKARRLGLLALFFVLLLSYFNLPPLSGLAGAVALPLFAFWYRQEGDAPWLLALLVLELAHATAITLAIVPAIMGSYTPLAVGGTLGLVSLVRGALFLRYRMRAAKQPAPQPAEDTTIHRLR